MNEIKLDKFLSRLSSLMKEFDVELGGYSDGYGEYPIYIFRGNAVRKLNEDIDYNWKDVAGIIQSPVDEQKPNGYAYTNKETGEQLIMGDYTTSFWKSKLSAATSLAYYIPPYERNSYQLHEVNLGAKVDD